MSKSNENMSKSNEAIEVFRPRQLRCVCLYAGVEKINFKHSTYLHNHEFWQMDVIFEGKAKVQAGKDFVEINAGGCIFFPPKMMHRFQYVRGSRYTTIRFQTGIQETAWRSADLLRAPKTKALYKALCAMFDKKGKDPLPDTEFVLDALVSTLFELCYALNPKEKQASVLADGLRAYLRERGGEYATVESVASRWGLSAGRFSARFRSETGCSLKSFLDRERGEIAKQLVIFSDLSLKQIAFRMGFNDLFCFSRFFKRIYGVSPRSVRMRGLSLTDMRVIAKNPKTSA